MITSKLLPVLEDFWSRVVLYPPVQIELPANAKGDKRRTLLSSEVDTFYKEVHWLLRSPIKGYSESILLARNEVVLESMYKEVGEVLFYTEEFNKSKTMFKHVQELNQYYKQFKLKPEDISKLFVEDIKTLCDTHNVQVDLKLVFDKVKFYYERAKVKAV